MVTSVILLQFVFCVAFLVDDSFHLTAWVAVINICILIIGKLLIFIFILLRLLLELLELVKFHLLVILWVGLRELVDF